VTTEVIVAVSAGIASFLSGLLGLGGAIVLAPLLLYAPPLVGATAVPVKAVTGLTIVQAVSASVIGVLRHHRYGNVSLRLVKIMGPTAALASLVGAVVARGASDQLLVGIFAAFSLLGALGLVLPDRGPQREADEMDIHVAPLLALAIVVGFFGGMVGIGGIAFIVAALIYLMRVPPHVAIGTGLGVGFFAAIAAFVGKAATAQVDPVLAATVLVAALVASPLGAAVAQRTHPRALTLALAAVIALSGLRLAWHAITGV
jgi:hypothetical protein